MNKVIVDGKVAVLYSPGYGAGWFSWHNVEELIYDPEVVKLVEKMGETNSKWREADKRGDVAAVHSLQKYYYALTHKIVEYTEKNYDAYAGGADQLSIAWLPVGTKFRITEYDGSEGLEYEEEQEWMVA